MLDMLMIVIQMFIDVVIRSEQGSFILMIVTEILSSA